MAEEKLVAKISADSEPLQRELDNVKGKVRDFGQANRDVAAASSANWKELAGAMLGAGSAMAIITKGVQSLVRVMQELSRAATEAVLNVAKLNTGSQREASAVNYQQATQAQEALRKYYELATKAEREGGSESDALRAIAERDIRRKYGFLDINFSSSDLRGEIEDALDRAQKKRLEAINAELKAYDRADEELDERLSRLSSFQKDQIEALQALKNANAERRTELLRTRREIEREQPGNDFRRLAKAKEWDEQEKEAQARSLEQQKRLLELRKQHAAALSAYTGAVRDEQAAARELADVRRRLAREARLDELDARRRRTQERMSRYGFQPFEGFSVNESYKSRMERVRLARLDEGIAEKMARQERGERTFYTAAERERIQSYQQLKRRDSQLEATQKQMLAADRQREAAESIRQAAETLRERGVARNYTAALAQLHGDLVKMYSKTFLVK